MNAWLEKLYETFIASGGYRYIIEGFRNTIIITLGALAIGVVIGSLIAIIKYFAEESPRLKPLAVLCDLYTTVIRGIPITVLLLIFYLIILVRAADLTVAILAFGITNACIGVRNGSLELPDYCVPVIKDIYHSISIFIRFAHFLCGIGKRVDLCTGF